MTDPISPVLLRVLMHRKVLAAYRHRTAVARRLHMGESEIAALTHLAQGGMTPGELGRRMQLTSGGMTALLHRLHRAGHVAQQVDAGRVGHCSQPAADRLGGPFHLVLSD